MLSNNVQYNISMNRIKCKLFPVFSRFHLFECFVRLPLFLRTWLPLSSIVFCLIFEIFQVFFRKYIFHLISKCLLIKNIVLYLQLIYEYVKSYLSV